MADLHSSYPSISVPLSDADKGQMENLQLRGENAQLRMMLLHKDQEDLQRMQQKISEDLAEKRAQFAKTYGLQPDTIRISRDGIISGMPIPPSAPAPAEMPTEVVEPPVPASPEAG